MVKTILSNAGGTGSIPGQEAKIPHASQPKNQNIKQKRSEEHTSELQSHSDLVCRLLLEKKKGGGEGLVQALSPTRRGSRWCLTRAGREAAG